jgi:hypothetical protein
MQTQARIWWLKLLPLYDQTDDPVSGKHESLDRVGRDAHIRRPQDQSDRRADALAVCSG